jgi:uncharacterized phage protein gp47/JayE
MFNTDSLAVIRERVASHFEAIITDENGQPIDAHTPGTGYTEEAIVVAGVSYGQQQKLAWVANQVNNQKADDTTIVQRAAEKGIPRIAPSFAAGTYTFVGTDGAVAASETVLQHSSGKQFRTTAEGTVAAGIISVAITAMAAGTDENLAAGETLSLITPITGIDSNGTIDAPGLTAGADIEPMDRVRERVVEFDQQAPMGGKEYDYVAWAKAAHVDVTRAWTFPHENGIGSMVLRFVTEDLADPIPAAATVTAVDDHVNTERPAGLRNYTTEGCVAKPLSLEFTTLDANTPAVQAAVEAELSDFIRRKGKPDGTLILSQIRAAISAATGEDDFVITLNANFVCDETQIPTLGVTTWPGA